MFKNGFTSNAWIGERVLDNQVIAQSLKFFPNYTSTKIYVSDTPTLADTNASSVVDNREEN